MFRRVLSILSVLSLAMLVGVAVLSALPDQTLRLPFIRYGRTEWQLVNTRDTLAIERKKTRPFIYSQQGFLYDQKVLFLIPHSLAILLLAMPPIAWVMLKLRARTVHHGKCGRCGYDMRATPERCPECGMMPKT